MKCSYKILFCEFLEINLSTGRDADRNKAVYIWLSLDPRKWDPHGEVYFLLLLLMNQPWHYRLVTPIPLIQQRGSTKNKTQFVLSNQGNLHGLFPSAIILAVKQIIDKNIVGVIRGMKKKIMRRNHDIIILSHLFHWFNRGEETLGLEQVPRTKPSLLLAIKAISMEFFQVL